MLLLLFLLIGSVLGQRCPSGWSYYNKSCYKHILDPNNLLTHDQIRKKCADERSGPAGADSPEASNYLSAIASRPGNWASKVDSMVAYQADPALYSNREQIVIGAYRYGYNWLWYSSTSTYFKWCTAPPPTGPEIICSVMFISSPCIVHTPCNKTYSRYICQKNYLPLICNHGAELDSESYCRCKKDFFDIKDANVPEGKLYEKGEMCIPRTPCQNVTSKASLSIVFVVDSSQSIGAKNWKDMVKWLQRGATQLDNSIKVGFVKFSTNVTNSGWLPTSWNKNDYLDQTPSDFDAGYTNTPAALDKAREMFRSDKSSHKVAVLITDGMPYVAEGILPKEDAMPKTEAAAKSLYNANVDLVALGYGKELGKYQKYLRQVLKRPRQDYFEFDKEASDLKDIHMTILLNKVCERY